MEKYGKVWKSMEVYMLRDWQSPFIPYFTDYIVVKNMVEPAVASARDAIFKFLTMT
jgi:hypothetical protein